MGHVRAGEASSPLSCSGCFWGEWPRLHSPAAAPLPSLNEPQRSLGAKDGGPPKPSTARGGQGELGQAGRSGRGELGGGKQGTR